MALAKHFTKMDKEAEEALRNKIIRLEGLPAKPFWNRQDCMESEHCEHYKQKKKENPRNCLFNPKMFECPDYRKYEGLE